MKKRILPVLLACTLVMQSGVWALAEELIAADEGVFYELEENSGEIAEEAAICDSSDECFESLQEETAEANECVMLEEEPESQGESAEFAALDGVSEPENNEPGDTDAESKLQSVNELAAELQILDEIVIEDIVVVDTAEYAAAATAASGTCGTDVSWTLDSSANLVISGTGAMEDYAYWSNDNHAPWIDYLDANLTLNSVKINSGVTKIGAYAFNMCWINSIQLPDTLVEIGEKAFSSCNSLSQITIPDSVTTLGDCAFYGTDLVSASVPDSVTNMGEGVFGECYSLVSVKLPANMTEIPERTFYFGWALAEIEIPSGVTKIGDNAFNQCKSLTEITLPDGLTSIGAANFANCASLREIRIPASVTSIGDKAFRYMSYFDGVDYGDVTFYFMGDMPAFGSDVFTGVHGNLYYLDASADTWAGGLDSLGGDALIINQFGNGTCGENVTWSLNSSGVLTIFGSGAMTDYSHASVDEDATPWDFVRDNIFEVVIAGDTENPITYIGEESFAGCENLKKVTISNGVTSIGGDAFSNCYSLEEILIPDTVTSIGAGSFYFCKALQNISLPDGLTEIQDFTFYECGLLEGVTIPATVTTIGEFAFGYCENLQDVTIEEGSVIDSIEMYAFCSTGVRTFEMPDTVSSLGLGVLWGNTSLEQVSLSQNIKTIPGNMFGYCTELSNIEIPSGVTRIDLGAFEKCALTSVRIPAGVTEIGAAAFWNCTELKEVYFEGNQPTVLTSEGDTVGKAFDGVTAAIKYPLGGTGWSNGIPEDWGGTLTMLPYGAAEGTCGTNLTWMLGVGGTVQISGSGAMTDYTNALKGGESAPWLAYEEIDITKVLIGDGVTSVGDYAFYSCRKLEEIQLGDSLTSIGTYAFGECTAAQLMIPASVTVIETEAFRDSALTDILFKGDLPECGSNAFAVNPSLVEEVSITYPEESASWTGVNINSLGGVPDDYSDIQYNFSAHKHTWDGGTVTKAAACTATGSRLYTCSVCEKTRTASIPKIAHRWNSGVITTAAKCTTTGVKTYTCSACKGTRTETVAATGHAAGSWQALKAATCTKTGTRVQKCTRCSTVLKSQTIAAYGHYWNAWQLVSNATVFEPKKETRACAICGTSESRTIGTALTPTVSLNTSNLPIQVGKSTTALKVQRIQNGDYVVSWTSSKPSVATVNAKTGKITAKKAGTTKITVTTAASATHTITVKVQKTAVKSKFMSIVGYTKHTVPKGKKLDLVKTMQPTVYPLTTSEKLKFTSSNKKVATVSSKGVVTAKAAGTAKITMKSGKAKEVVTIVVPKTKTTKITGVKEKISLKKGKTYTLKPKLTPSNSDEKITYKTSDKKIAKVSGKGKITAKKKGNATITVKSGSVSVKCKVSVK